MTDYTPTTEEEEENLPRTQDCATCNTNGPELPPSPSAFLAFHRASHDAVQTIAQPFIDFFERYARWMTDSRKDKTDD